MLCEKYVEVFYQQHSKSFQESLFYWILESSDYFKNFLFQVMTKGDLYLAFFVLFCCR